MNICETRQALGAQASGDHRRAALLETAAVQLRVLDDILKAVLAQAGEVEIEAVGTSKNKCLELISRYRGLRIRHNGQTLDMLDVDKAAKETPP